MRGGLQRPDSCALGRRLQNRRECLLELGGFGFGVEAALREKARVAAEAAEFEETFAAILQPAAQRARIGTLEPASQG